MRIWVGPVLRPVERSGKVKNLLAVLDRLLVLMPEAWSEFRDRGLVHAELGALAQAVQDLETYLTRAPAQPDRATIEDRLADLRGHLRG